MPDAFEAGLLTPNRHYRLDSLDAPEGAAPNFRCGQ